MIRYGLLLGPCCGTRGRRGRVAPPITKLLPYSSGRTSRRGDNFFVVAAGALSLHVGGADAQAGADDPNNVAFITPSAVVIVTTSLAAVCFTSESDQTAEIPRGPSRAIRDILRRRKTASLDVGPP
jgi:hypothetical protein